MKRLTTETPKENFETTMNYVYSKDGWAHIRHDGDNEDVPATQWAKKQCLLHNCDEFPAETPEEIDEMICGCMMDATGCSVALAYCFACQASHLRDRLKMYEDIIFSEDGMELLTLDMLRKQRTTQNNAPLTLDELREMNWEPAWVDGDREMKIGRSGWAIIYYSSVEKYVLVCWPMEDTADIPNLDCYGDTWQAFRCKPEGRITDEV